ncbi:hypothetical protein BS50DRAFT_585272 [Corynespora cassiicola Philippines]|uniref:Uncharacterized protein n=1 Tax=Corynespora cassiicola Philippines TaxID=1448308 RepID=A0A2T2NWD8_CORCC|nr:hypothetical protein BS50DRAFT_585272 [Corynespora cassiicola Philippines]
MERSREGKIRAPFTHDNLSSSSLVGMERPVRSFKSFIKTVPPPPNIGKPLPPAPSSSPTKSVPSPLKGSPSPPSSVPSPTTPGRNSSVASWKAPAEWSESGDTPPTPPIPANRTLSPLLPDPSPDIADQNMEAVFWQTGPAPQQSRLRPIYEQPTGSSEFGPPRTPPKSPLPDIPVLNAKENEQSTSPVSNGPKTSKGSRKFPKKKPPTCTCPKSEEEPVIRPHRPKGSKEKAFASLGIGSPRQQRAILRSIPSPYKSSSCSPDWNKIDQKQTRGKILRAVNKGSPLTDDSWEDTELDDKTRRLGFSQDYHNLLTDQYKEMSLNSENSSKKDTTLSRRGSKDDIKPRPPPKDYQLVPRPLSWRKSASPHSSIQSGSHVRASSAISRQKSKHSVRSWKPRRLSVGHKRSTKGAERRYQDGDSATKSTRQKRIPEAEVDKALKEEVRFSRFLSPGKATKFRKRPPKISSVNKESHTPSVPPPPPPPPPPQAQIPLIRLPRGLAIVRNVPTPASVSGEGSIKMPSPPSGRLRRFSRRLSSGSPKSYSDDQGSSIYSHQSNSPVTPTAMIRNRFRDSIGSLYSHRSSSSNPNQWLAYESPRSQPPIPSSPPDSPLSLDSRRLLQNNTGDSDSHKQSRLDKVNGVLWRHDRKGRQERLKRSIRVLGPTDPAVVSAYVKPEDISNEGSSSSNSRMPGYMVSGPV